MRAGTTTRLTIAALLGGAAALLGGAAALLGGAAALAQCLPAAAQEHAEFWRARDDANPATIDHGPWQATLDAYLRTGHPSGIHRFDYAALQGNAGHGERLAQYLASVQRIDPRRYAAAEQKAYWINLYNALTVRLVTAAYPVQSVRDLGEAWFSIGPWDDVVATVAGRDLTLNDIEHEILRPIWHDNRIHYAVNCASLGCPNMVPVAFTAANTERLLEESAKAYVNHPRGVRVAEDGRRVVVSSVYRWYREDFGDDEADVLKHLARYAEPKLADRLRAFDGDVDYAYDWALNDP